MKRLLKKADAQEDFNKLIKRDNLFDFKACINKLNSYLRVTKMDFKELLDRPMTDQINEFAGYNLEEIIGGLKSAIKNVTKLKEKTEFNDSYLKELQNLYDTYNTKFDDNRAKVKELLDKIDELNAGYISEVDNNL